MINWQQHYAAIWRPKHNHLRPVARLDPIRLERLLQVDRQKQLLITNTQRFLAGQPANHALLWGAKGTGKSSLIKALLNEYAADGLRVVEVDKADLIDLPEIVDHIHMEPYRFILFCDDLSFDSEETSYKHLKSVLEGSIELPPDNVVLYATSNRRHLVPQTQADNNETLAARMADTSVLHSDTVEEKLSLADRFGLWLSFYPISWQEYQAVVESLFEGVELAISREELLDAAKLFARSRGTNSARTAKQFYQSMVERKR
ncbi:ATP-binding protein [Halioxenophilus sp. WMMB6]|uniref:ATP-binding protein n=1 Tax=Halioxenophilus sp. WMMB6 TaxID=3073815 RepID=UPI00295E2A52|nr:ATP-binding protein [Halioxenophilus sp. WMMB6]